MTGFAFSIHRDRQAVEVSGDDQPGLVADEREHRALLVGEHDRARAGRAGRGADAAKALLDFLKTPEAAAVLKAKGLTPG